MITTGQETNSSLGTGEARDVLTLLGERARREPSRPAYFFLADGEAEESSLTYGELYAQSQAVAVRLRELGAAGERVLLLYPPGLEYVSAFFGCLYAGAVAVPLYPPRPNRTLGRVQSIAADSEAKFALTTAQVFSRVDALFEQASELRALRWLTTDELAAGEAAGGGLAPAPDLDALAYLQYTSGSTATPKGIMVSHGNLLHNSAYLDSGWRHTGESRVVSWLPHFHDMGLVYGIVQPLYKGFPAYLMPPAAFLQRPMLWLRAISRYRATHSSAPNFAYDICVRKADAEECEGLDLSCWEVAVNGAEPIRPATLEQFTETFAPYGFRAEAFCPGYGLAEATLKVSASSKGDAPVYCTTQAAALEQHRVVLAEDGEAQAQTQTLVGCGRLAPELKIAVVHPELMRPCAPDEVGEIWVAGPSVALGYWNRPEETGQTFGAYLEGGADGPYLRTGDLGFVVEGELYLTGRLKDLVIIRGRNHYPQDVELTAEQSHPDLRPGCGAAFSVEVAGEERLVIVQEVRRQYRAERLEEVAGAVRRDVAEAHELQVYAVVLVKPGGIHKTSSGKIQRHACRAGFLADRLGVVGRSVLEDADESRAAGEPPTRAELLAAGGEERRRLLASALREEAARLLKVSPARLSTRRPLNTYGLDSLAALELAHWVETRMGLSLQTTGLLAGAGLEELTDELVRQLDSPEPARAAAFEFPRRTIGEHPLSYNQQALWLVHLLDREGPAYNISYTARVGVGVDATALRRVCQALVYRHASLRTTYAARDGQPVQLIREHQTIDFETVDASELGDEELSEKLKAEADRPFDLEGGGGVLRVRLFERAGGEHVLLLAVHHIACDFWSLDLLASELRALLQAEAEGAKAAPAPHELNYTDFTYWQADVLAGPEGERLWSYWREQLAGELPVLDLPTDRPRPPAQCYQGAAYTFELGEELGRELAAFAAREGATLYTTLLACFYVLLYRYGGQEDILVGSPTSGRGRPEFKDIVGHFVNPVVLRARPEGSAAFRSFLREVRATVVGALAHQDFPFTLLAERLQPTRDPSLSPLFQVAFAWEKPQLLRAQGEARQAANRGAAGGQAAELHDFLWRQGGAPYDLMLVALDEGEAPRLTLQYRTELFEEARVARMAEHFRRLVAGVVEDPARKLSELSLLGEEEQRQLVVGWNQTRADYERDTCLHELFARRAADAPDAVAARDEAGQVTYAELDRRSNQLARRLRRLGVGPESVVGLLLPRGVRLVEAVLAVLKAGAAYLPLDTTSPAERLRLMVEGAAAPLVLTEAGGREKLKGVGATIADLDAEGARLSRESGEPFASGVTSENLAYVIYTSGSTGRPKGVAVSHRAVVNLLTDFERRRPLSAGEACSMWTSTGFDVSVYELFSPLAAGATLHFVPERLRTQATDFLDWLEGERIQSAYVPPFMLAELAERLRASAAPRLALRRLLVGVEPIPEQTLAEIVARLPGLGIINGYGPTEATVCATLYDVDAAAARAGNTPIGRPVRNTQVYLLDRDRNPVQVGTAGELHLGGDGLARGYLGLPELTAERFVPCPFAEGGGARMYRTGDLARHLADGNVEFLGRVDEQLKIHGVRIEPGEIETVLSQSPAVRDSVVTVGLDARGDKRLVAYVVPSPEHSVTPSELRRHLQGKLPGFMTPSAFVLLESLPQTRNGKIDRNALPAPRERDYGQADGFVAPRTPVEELLAGIWQEVLGVEHVGVEDDFFDLGGHSLLATQLISRIRQSFEVDIPLPDFFETPNVVGLAEKIEAAVRTGASPELPPVERVPRKGPAPLSFAQSRLWFLEQLEPGTPLYNIPLALRLSGRVNPHALEQGVGELCKRHEALRTAFDDEPEPAQVVHAAGPFGLGLVDLSGLAAERRSEAARTLMREESERPFDLRRAPLMRVRLLRMGASEHLLLLSLHHLVSDGWSLRLLLAELGELYAASSAGLPDALPDPPLQYADYAAWQQEALTPEALSDADSYWRTRLEGAPPLLELPADRARGARQGWQGASEPVALGAGLSAGLRAVCRSAGATLFMGLLAGFQALLSRYAGVSEVVVGSPVANRGVAGVGGVVGLFANTVALRTDLSGDPSFRELLGRVRGVCLGAYEHESYPFERVVEWAAGGGRELSYAPLVQVMLAMQEEPLQRSRWGSLEVRREPYEGRVAKFDLTLMLGEEAAGEGEGDGREGGEVRGRLEYRTELFDAWRVRAMATHLRNLLAAAVADPDRRLSRLPLLGEEERHQLTVGWNQTQADYEGGLAHELFAAQAARTPEAVAASDEGGHLTYAELDRRSNRLARRLRRLGVGPEKVVALHLPRGLRLVEAALGVLKAGGVYLPLDTTSPAARLRLMVEDAGAVVVLAESDALETFDGSGAMLVGLADQWPLVARESAESFTPEVSGENLAYVIYTSGSTGRPKGVQVTHEGLANLIHWHQNAFGVTPSDRATLLASPAFDASVWELWPYLTAGASVHVPDAETQYSPDLLREWLARQAVTVTFLPTPLAESLLTSEWPKGHALRTMLTGGDKLQRYPAEGLGFELVNNYGPTESSVVATSGLTSAKDKNDSPPPIGRPVANTRAYVLDAAHEPAPAGVHGQLALAGRGLMRGYLGRPDQTAERLRPDHLWTEPGARLYLTGDLVRHLPDGRLEFHGRLDRQLKMRGLRIEPGEVEAALCEHSSVRRAAVEIDESGGAARLVAYVVSGPGGAAATAGELREHLRARIPDYMVPSRYMRLEELPLTASGKVDRARLPEAGGEAEEGRAAEFVGARNAAEEVLVGVFEEVLGVGGVGVNDDFFALGGHSLLAARAAARARERLGVEVGVRQLFERPTPAGLAATLGESKAGAPPAAAPSISRLSRELYRAKAPARDKLDIPEALRKRP